MVHILVTCDENYLSPLQTMLYSLKQHNQSSDIKIWLIHESISESALHKLSFLCNFLNFELESLQMNDSLFDEARTEDRYPKEMYFRLLCAQILPDELDRILYLDPDILIINSIDELWNLDLQGQMMAASTHTGITGISAPINNVRLNTDHGYFNSGVLLIDLNLARTIIKASEISQTIEKYNQFLLLPDQDVLNHLYGKYILEIPEEIFNYDARRYVSYLARSLGEYNLQWVIEHAVVLHFCGRPKPWDDSSDSRFTALYLNYHLQCERILKNLE